MKTYVQLWWCPKCEIYIESRATTQTGFLDKLLCSECATKLHILESSGNKVVVDFSK